MDVAHVKSSNTKVLEYATIRGFRTKKADITPRRHTKVDRRH